MNDLGKLAEIKAADYLKKKRYKLVDVNFTTRFGEIDLVVKNKKYLCFIEVKQRDVNSYALPREYVDYNKQKKICAAAQIYLQRYPTKLQPRFDVIEVYTQKDKIKSIKHLENAFDLV